MGVLRQRVGEAGGAFAGVFRNRDLRRLELAFAGSDVGGWAAIVALTVLAFGDGGAEALGVVLFLRMIPPAIAAPFMGLLADRFPRKAVMVASDLVRAGLIGAAAVILFADGPLFAVYALVSIVSVVSTAFRPAQAAILPSLARSPDELTAANVASSTIESVGAFVGPALGGVLFAATNEDVCFAASAGTFLWSAFLLAGIREPRAAKEQESENGSARVGFVQEALAGVRTLTTDRSLGLLVGLLTAQVVVSGVLFVLIAPLAFDFLGSGEEGFGALVAALGVGGIVGAAVSLGLVGRRLSSSFAVGVVLWGAPIALLPVFREQAAALVLLGLVGLANTLVDVSGFTLMQRAVPDEVLARVFGILESLLYGATALGAILAPALIAAFGLRGAFVATGVFLPALVAVTWRAVARIDARELAPVAGLELLRGIPFVRGLPAAVVDELASRLARVELPAGETVFRQGDEADRFYVVDEGVIDISVDGQPAPELRPGGYFGEIGLLRGVPRTATATARTDATLYSLDRDTFVAAVTGHSPSAEAADAVVAARLSALRPAIITV